MFLRHQELNDAVLPVDQFAARTAETLTAMLNRQGEVVVDAVSDMIKRYSSELAQNVLPNDCLLRIVVAPSEEGFQKQQGDVFAVHHAGSSWAVTYQGITRNSPNSKGIRTIARLLRHPGQEFHVLDLANDLPLDHAPADWQSLRGHSLAEIDGDGLSVHRSIVGSADEILDPQARREYQQRLNELETALATSSAELNSEKIGAEADVLRKELGLATGLGGRSRTFVNDPERARKKISASVHRTLGRIAKFHPDLHRHLEVSLKIGNYCSYQHEPPVNWRF